MAKLSLTRFGFFRQLNARNLKTLWKALRQEPLDLIAENFWQFLKTGRRQSVYSDKFFDADEALKIYVQDCRKEQGVLTVIVWVLAKEGLKDAILYAGAKRLGGAAHIFVKPELEALFSAFGQFQQKGLIFQIPTPEPFATISLLIIDQQDHQISLPIGQFFLYDDTQKESLPVQERIYRPGLVLLLHNWGLPPDQLFDPITLEKRIGEFPLGNLDTVMLCTDQMEPVAVPKSESSRIVQVSFPNLNDHLCDLEFDYLLILSLDAVLSKDLFMELAKLIYERTSGFVQMMQPFFPPQAFGQPPQGGTPSMPEELSPAGGPCLPSGTDIIYFDEDLLEAFGRFHSPTLKPDFSPERLTTDNYVGANFCVSKAVGEQLHWFSPSDQLSGAYDFLLRALEQSCHFYRLPNARIHLPDYNTVYYEQRAEAEEQVRTVHYTKLGYTIHSGTIPGTAEVLRPLRSSPLVSIVIPFKDQVALLDRCLQSILTKTRYPHLEVLLVSNNSEEAATLEYLDRCCREDQRFRMLRWDQPFNYAALNNWAVEQAQGEILLFLNNDIEVITEGWLGKLLSYLEDPAVGAVGAKLLYPDDTVQHAGIIVGFGGVAAHAYKHYPDAFGGYDGRANQVQNVSACTAACLLVRRTAFEKAGGFDAKHLPIAFNDVDLCLEIRKSGYRIVYTPFVKLYHYESISRGKDDTPAKRKRARREVGWFRKKWKKLIRTGDPYYHPELSLRRVDFETK